MTGREAYDKNQSLEEKFFKDKCPEARLWRWQHVNALHVPKGTTNDEYRALKFAHTAKSLPKE